MALYMRGPEVDALATMLQRQTDAPSKTEAVRTALVHELERSRTNVSLRGRIARLQAEAVRIGLPNPDFDMKKFTDEMWED
ncbi:type II toxin-antitoxin system VapB family antitoxin [Mesorhizobium sp. M0910]|uniref:type II toxin-antitoxin system VapB family antitoxin n=1 Tax=Mesorhizobium sp. M0910 TaxID=2957025 RepID=UPI00333CCA69